MTEARAPIPGYVVRVDAPGTKRAFDTYSVVAADPDEALALVRKHVGDAAAVSILRPLSGWEVGAFNLFPGAVSKDG